MKPKKLNNREYKTITAEIEVSVKVVAKVQFEFDGEQGFDVNKALNEHVRKYGEQKDVADLDTVDVLEILDVYGCARIEDAVSDKADSGDFTLIKVRK